MLDAPVKPGDVLAGKYRVERVLGRGGIGVVVAAYHLALDQTVALKFLHGVQASTPQAMERFHREARAAAKLRSEHVARVLDTGTLETGAPYIVMEYLEGEDLSVLTQRRPLPIPEAVAYVLQACEAMAEAHAAGIVHRDLKPANLFRTRTPDGGPLIKVLDFGIAKMATPTTGNDHSLTHTRALMGSPLYMSPEQLESARDVDARTDIWALGAIVYEIITGRPPFLEESLPRLCVTILQKEPEPPSRFASHIPPALDAVILRCLSKRLEQRFQTVAELAQALEPFAPAHALDSIRRILSTTRSGRSDRPSADRVAPTSQDDAEAPTARAPSHQSGLAPTLPMPELSGTGPSEPMPGLSGTGPSEPRAWSAPPRPGSGTRPVLIGGAVLGLLLIAIVAVLFLGRAAPKAAVTPSASAPAPIEVIAPLAASSAPEPAPEPVVEPAASASLAPNKVKPTSNKPQKPATGAGVLSNDRE